MKIITHDGLFHADEVFAIALLHRVFHKCPVERTRTISQEDLDDPETWVVDVSGVLNHDLHNFDHHQNSNLVSSNLLVLNYLYYESIITQELYDEIFDTFLTISHIDTNGSDDMNGFQVSSLIKSFNHIDKGWDLALSVAGGYIDFCIDSVHKARLSLEIWERAEIISLGVRLVDAFPIHWKRYEQANFIICPDGEKWKLLSCDSNKYPIYATGNEEFIHNGKFIAVYSNKEDALHAGKYQSLHLVG